VLLALPYSDAMPCTLRENMFEQLRQMECGNPGFNLELGLFDEPYRCVCVHRFKGRVLTACSAR
jgi:hypothetical protein